MRLIDADALEKVLQKRSDELFDEHFPKMSGTLAGAICYVVSAPTVDAVPVVGCKDCKYYKKSEKLSSNKFCFRLMDATGAKHIGYNYAPDDFCSYGKRKENV